MLKKTGPERFQQNIKPKYKFSQITDQIANIEYILYAK